MKTVTWLSNVQIHTQALCLVLAFLWPQVASADDLDNGRQALEEGRFCDAQTHFETAIRELGSGPEPEDLRLAEHGCMFEQGLDALENGDPCEAEQLFEHADAGEFPGGSSQMARARRRCERLTQPNEPEPEQPVVAPSTGGQDTPEEPDAPVPVQTPVEPPVEITETGDGPRFGAAPWVLLGLGAGLLGTGLIYDVSTADTRDELDAIQQECAASCTEARHAEGQALADDIQRARAVDGVLYGGAIVSIIVAVVLLKTRDSDNRSAVTVHPYVGPNAWSATATWEF